MSLNWGPLGDPEPSFHKRAPHWHGWEAQVHPCPLASECTVSLLHVSFTYAILLLQHQTLLLSPVISTTGYCFCFGSIPSFFLELFLHQSPVAYWDLLTWGVHLSVSFFLPFRTLHGILKVRILKWFSIPFSS